MTQPSDRVRALLRHTADHIPGGPVAAPGPGLVTRVAPARRRRGLLLAAVFALVLFAVAAPVVALNRHQPQPPPLTSTPLPVDCGTFELSQREDLPDSAIRCFAQALEEKRPARLTVTLPTIEGDPIVFSYRSEPDGHVEVITDTTRDKFGPRRIDRKICTGPTPGTIFTFSQCSEPTPKAS